MPNRLRIKRSQFRLLFRVFSLRIIDLEALSPDGDTHKLMGQFAGLFAAVSLLFTVPLIVVSGRLPGPVQWTAEHLFLATTMLVVGILSVLTWDSVFPDRRDILTLAPLPVRIRTLFWAKLSALAAVLGISVIAVNVFTGFTWPFLLAHAGGLLAALRSIAAYWIAITAAGTFLFCAILNLQGVTALLLPRQYFLRLSALLQVAVFSLLLCDYFLEPSLESISALTAPQNQRLLAWLPAYWFLGLFQQINGSMQPAFAPLALRAWIALAAALLLSTATLLFSYFRTLPMTVEQPDILPGALRLPWTPRLGNSVQTAVVMFSLRCLFRSRQHRVILSFYLGVGIAAVLVFLKNPFAGQPLVSGHAHIEVPALAASILVLSLVVGGIRVVSAIPMALGANWIFRITEIRSAASYLGAVRRVFLVLGVAPVWLGFAVLFLAMAPSVPAVEHLLVVALLGAILTEICTLGSARLPFTCSYLPGKRNIQFVFWACVAFLIRLTVEAAKLEQKAFANPFRYAVMIAALLIVWAGARRHTAVEEKTSPTLRFEDLNPAEVISLNLHRD